MNVSSVKDINYPTCSISVCLQSFIIRSLSPAHCQVCGANHKVPANVLNWDASAWIYVCTNVVTV